MISSDVFKKYNVPSDTQVRIAISRRKEEIMDYWKSTKDLDREEEDILNHYYDTLDRANFMFTKEFNEILKGNVRADCPGEDEPLVITKQEVDDWSYTEKYLPTGREPMSRKDVPYDAMGDYSGFKFSDDE